ncbi:MAG: ABC transporter ATP-binding protein [Clostridiales bacterium]
MEIIRVDNITKDYGKGKGVFDVSFSVNKGEVMGFLGPNGAGKTTTIRQLMGFIKPDKGTATILGMDCFSEAAIISQNLGYLPGEISFLDNMTGIEFIKFIAKMKRIKDLTRAKELMAFFELNPTGKIRKMSKGMKQKIGIVCCFMQNPDTLILDEPTGGLDPLMQSKFIELILAEKQKGTTILMSSHIFEEVDKTCDRTAIIKDGRIVAVENMDELRRNKVRVIEVRFENIEDAKTFGDTRKNATRLETVVTTNILGEFNEFIKDVSKYTILDMEIRNQSLEELFMHFYGGENNDKLDLN